jgi:glycosyltransferase involved in cell wall biosynthesis
MPVCNEAGFIERSLASVLSQDYPPQLLKVIVADGMSTDGTREVLVSLQTTHSNFQLVDNPGKIVATGLNAAMEVATGDIIVRVDGHCEIAPDYVRRCVEHLENGDADGVGGPIETVGQTYLARVIACAMSSSFGVGGSAFRTGTREAIFTDTIAFPAYTRATTERAGPYDEELVRNQDDEYNYRIRKFGGRLLLAPDVKSRYFSRSSLRSLWRQYFQYGYWKVRVIQKHPRQMRPRQFAPFLLVTALAASLGLWTVSELGRWAFLTVALTYLVVNIVSTITTAANRNWTLMPLLPIVYTILHTSYGLGNVLGLIRFGGRWKAGAFLDGPHVRSIASKPESEHPCT